MLSAKKELFTPSGGGYQISRSVRTRSSVSAYFNRTFSTPTLGTKWTWSGWVKRGTLGAAQTLFGGSSDVNNWGYVGFLAGDTLTFQQADAASVTSTVTTTQVFRDPSAWYHIVVAFDSTQATAANRLIMYVNGVQITAFGTATYLAQNTASRINQAVAHTIYRLPYSAANYVDGYLTEANFIDGQALTPSSFGETNALTGVWQPKRYTGTYGNNGFYLNFSDNSATDALGYDFSTGLYSKNLRTSGTNIGTFTANGGLTAAFDGNFNQPNASSARVSTPAAGYNTAVIGKDWGAGVTKTITAVQLFSQNDGGFVGGTTTALVFKLQGSNDNSTWTDLTSPITGPATGANTIITVTSGITTSTAYRYHRINVNADGANNYYMCELAFYEAGSYNLNNWFPNNISLTAGATYDSMLDVPTLYADGGNGRGNYCVMNPLASANALTYANLRQGTSAPINFATFGQATGKWYWEVTLTTQSTAALKVGIANSTATGELGDTATGWGYIIQSNANNGQGVHNGSTTSTYSTFAAGDILGVAVDVDAGKIWWSKNGTWVNSGVPASGTGAVYTDVSGTVFPAASNIDKGGGSGVLDWNFGQRPFTYTPPTGFKALNTQNLPTPTISNGATVMAATLWTGNGTSQSISNAVNGISFQPDMVWVKDRSAARSHVLIDAVRGTGLTLFPNETTADQSNTDRITSFNSNGFSVGAGLGTNANTETYVGWQWNAGGTSTNITVGQYGTSPNVPSIASTVRANPTAGFSVVTYTGAGGVSTIGHGLGVEPSFFVVKNRTQASDWECYFATLGNTTRIVLNSTAAQVTGVNGWNSTSPTSTVFTVNGGTAGNTAGNNHLAYCFAAVAGYSAFGKYTGNGSTDGPFVFTGFRPRFVMVKSSTVVVNWLVYDTARDAYNVMNAELFPNTSGAEVTASTNDFDFLSNGFKCRRGGTISNQSGETYIYMAFAENPFKNSLAR